MRIDLILAHFDEFVFEVEPALSSFRKYFPETRVVLYTDDKTHSYPKGVDEVREVVPPYERDHPRYGWRASDLYRGVGLLESDADLAIYIDSDMLCCSERIRTIVPLTMKFGLCLVANPRLLVLHDTLVGNDSDRELDETEGCGFAYNSGFISFNPKSGPAREYLEAYTRLMYEFPVRGPLQCWRAAMETGISPHLLPFQWGVCAEHLAVGDEIILHVGHRTVQEYYVEKRPLAYLRLRALWGKLRRKSRSWRRRLWNPEGKSVDG